MNGRTTKWASFGQGLFAHLVGNGVQRRKHERGLLVAFIGGDGAGKSTAIAGVNDWLADKFAVRKVHLGKPQLSLGSLVIKGLLKLSVWLGLYAKPPLAETPIKQVAPHQVAPHQVNDLTFPGYIWLIRHVLTARDRYRTYYKARQMSDKGWIIICDRYPLEQVTSMDGRRTGWVATLPEANRLIKYLVALETRYYEQIAPPDLLFVMRIDPEIAVQRRHDEEPEFVRRRSRSIWELDATTLPANVTHIIDAGQPKTTVLTEIKSIIRERL